jgi:hypothetical protein
LPANNNNNNNNNGRQSLDVVVGGGAPPRRMSINRVPVPRKQLDELSLESGATGWGDEVLDAVKDDRRSVGGSVKIKRKSVALFRSS